MSLIGRIRKHTEQHPLSYRLLAYILAFSSVFTLLGTFAQLYWEYRTDVGGIDAVLQQIEDSHLASLTTSLWMLDEDRIRQQVEGILSLPDVRHAEVLPADDQRVVSAGGEIPARNVTRTYPMIHEHRGEDVRVGSLVVIATLDGVYLHLRDKFLVILGTQAVKTFATSLFILFIVQFLFTRHLHVLGEHARHLSLTDLDTPLALKRWTLKRRYPRRRDELDLVVDAMEEMRIRLIADVAALNTAEEERERLITDLEAKNAQMERFTYTVSHDLKSPLITIQGFLSLLKGDLREGDVAQAEEDMERIASATKKMYRLLEDLLELSQAGRVIGQPVEVSLYEMASEAAELVSGKLAERGARVLISPQLPSTWGDSTRLRTVFQNLIENAVKFMGEEPSPRIEIGPREEDGDIVCFVRDNGVGIDSKEQERIFGLFRRLDSEAEGTGIGLALVQQIVEVHHGRIWVESEGRGHGSTFCFVLPAKGPQEVSGIFDRTVKP